MKTINLELRNIKVREYNDILLKAQTLTEIYNTVENYGEFEYIVEDIDGYSNNEISMIWNILNIIDDKF